MLSLVLFVAVSFQADTDRASPVGMPARIHELVLPGPELEVKDSDVATPVVVRISDVFAHGDAYRYDIEYYGLDPGDYDLRDFLERRDGSSTADLPALPIRIEAQLPPGQVEPHTLEPGELPRVGGYRTLAWIAGILWVIGLGAILYSTRRKDDGAEVEHARPHTLADRLRPLVEEALAGRLGQEESAQLELLLISYWRNKLDMQEVGAAEALAALREHHEAGPLLRSLEDWLHRPEPPADVDVGELLAPYRSLPADALERARS